MAQNPLLLGWQDKRKGTSDRIAEVSGSIKDGMAICSIAVRHLAEGSTEGAKMELLTRPQCIDDDINRHSLPVVRIYKAGPDDRIAADDKGRWNGQYPSIITLIRGNIPTGLCHLLLHLESDENREIERKRVAIVDVCQDRKRLCRGIRFQRSCELLQVWRYGDNLTAGGLDFALRLGQRICIEAAIGAPVPAMEG